MWASVDPRFVLSVNVSARQLQHDGLIDVVVAALAASGLPAGQLMLELTETALLRDLHEGANRLQPLHDLGVRIALDDFGTGYTSLQYLGTLPIDTIKIDRTFVDGLAVREDQRSLVQTIIELASRMRCEVVAEGIEQTEDAKALQDLGCDTGQGFAYHRPVPRDEIDVLMGVLPDDRGQLATAP
jgi:EAL domain-containing protein (putative c-di-GMP-specific phosphodiesterase class I)